MTPLPDTPKDLERCNRMRTLAFESYVATIKTVAQYAVELDEAITAPHRKYLNSLAEEVAARPEFLIDSRSTLRGLLRDYRDKAAQYLNNLREELANTTRSLKEIVDSVAQVDGDHEATLQQALERLRMVMDSPREGLLRAVARETADSIEQSLAKIKRQNERTVSQFMLEIQMLRKRIDTLESAVAIDNLTKLFSRGEMEDRIRTLPAGSFRLLLLKVNGFSLAEKQFGPDTAIELASAFIRRLRHSAPPEAVVGRWSDEEFIAILPLLMSGAPISQKWLLGRLSLPYVCLQAGKAVRPGLEVSVEMIDTHPGDNHTSILDTVEEFLNGEAEQAGEVAE